MASREAGRRTRDGVDNDGDQWLEMYSNGCMQLRPMVGDVTEWRADCLPISLNV